MLGKRALVFGDVGNTLTWIESLFEVYQPNTFFVCSSLAAMGYGVSASIGGQLAAPDKQVVCMCGDGDFQMQGMEVVTAVNYNIPVKWFIFNNQALAMIRDIQDNVFKGRRVSSDLVNPDFVKLAESMGAVGYRIQKPSQIETTVKEALSNDRPTVVDCQIDPHEVPSFDARAEAIVRAMGISSPLSTKLKYIPELLKRR
jgi:acetolactate synthase-1/2/3 large subunit